jgi:hypothetical protein
MASSDYKAIGPLDAAAQKEAIPLIGLIALAMLATVVAVYIVGEIANNL